MFIKYIDTFIRHLLRVWYLAKLNQRIQIGSWNSLQLMPNQMVV